HATSAFVSSPQRAAASANGLSALNRSTSPNGGDWLNEASSRNPLISQAYPRWLAPCTPPYVSRKKRGNWMQSQPAAAAGGVAQPRYHLQARLAHAFLSAGWVEKRDRERLSVSRRLRT